MNINNYVRRWDEEMRILDKDVREYFEGLSDEELKGFVDSKGLQLDGLIMDNNWDGRNEFKYDIKRIISRVALLREGKEFVKLPIDKMLETMFAHAKKNRDNNLIIKDEQYGLTYSQMNEIIDIATVKKGIKELVKEIPKEKLKGEKENFENRLCSNEFYGHYLGEGDKEVETLYELFGEQKVIDKEITRYNLRHNILMLDIEDAFEERENELGLSQNENKKENKSKGFFARIKNWWKNRHQKQLPPGQEESQIKDENQKNDFIDSLHVSSENMNKSNERQDNVQNRENTKKEGPSFFED